MLRNVVFFGVSIGLFILAFNWWSFMKINAERDLYRSLQQEMFSLEKEVNRVVLLERDVINQLLEKGELQAGVIKQSNFLNVLGKYQHLADTTRTGGFFADFTKALQRLEENRIQGADWRGRYNQLLAENGKVGQKPHDLLVKIRQELAAFEELQRKKAKGGALRRKMAENELSVALAGMRHDVETLAVLCDLIAVERDRQHLEHIEITHVQQLLAQIAGSMHFFNRHMPNELTAVAGQLDQFAISFWGENYQKGPIGDIITPGTGGFYHFHRQRIELEQEHDRLKNHIFQDFIMVRTAQQNLMDMAGNYLEMESRTIQKVLNRTWLIIVLTSFSMAFLFLLFSRRIIRICEKRIVERSAMISELRNSHCLLDQVFQTAGNGMRMIGADFTVLRVNDVFAELVGAPKETLEGGKCFEVFPGPFCHTEQCPVFLLQDGKERVEFEVEKLRADGKLITCRLRAAPLHNEQGEFLGIIEDFHDISDMVLAEKILRQAKESAEAANEIKGEFLANMSHEIRTPLNGIMGMTDLVLGTQLSADQRRFLEMVKTSANRLLDVVNEVLDFSKIESGSLEIDHIPFSLFDVVGNSLNILAFKAHDKGLQLTYEIEHDLIDGFIGDPGRLRQILVNLVGNSIKFTSAGKVLVTVTKAKPDEYPERIKLKKGERDMGLHFTVADTGIGIAPEMQERIFQAFSQVDGSSSRQHGGAGLGLTICAELISMMGGELWLESQPGAGTTFHFTLLLQTQVKQTRKFEPLPVGELQRMSFLVVAGEASGRFVLKEMINEWTKDVLIAGSAEDALKMTVEKRFNVIVLDSLPEHDQLFAVAHKLHHIDRNARIIMLTAAGQRGDGQRCREVGIVSYLLKPVSKTELLEALRMVLSRPGDAGLEMPLVTRHSIRESLHTLNVLLAEDEEINRVLAVELIRAQGWRVTTAENGRQVLDALQDDSFHVILMDMQMPEMDGFEAVSLIRKREKQSGEHIPVIALTAHAMTIDRQKCLDAGMDGYVSKPIDMKILRQEMEKVLGMDLAMKTVTLTPKKKGAEFIDYDAFLYDSCNGKVELARKLLRHLLQVSGPQWLEEVEAAIAADDEARLRKVCHSLKGTAATVSAHAFAEAGAELGKLAREGRMSETPKGFEQLKKEFNRIVEWARASDLDLL
ncbi:MAG: response regulator [Proteobacteria bacterium]|nr:response regulator [Pseudomonadota bacterium]